MFVIAYSNAFSGIHLIGPFNDFEEAHDYTQKGYHDAEWQIVKLDSPTLIGPRITK